MASRRALQIGGVTVVAGGAYYLYSAGGNPSVAEKKLERESRQGLRSHVRCSQPLPDDMSAASARLQGKDISGKEAQKKGEVLAKEAGATLDRTVCFLLPTLRLVLTDRTGRQCTSRHQRSR